MAEQGTRTVEQTDSRRVQEGYDAAAVESRWKRQWQVDDLYRVDDDAPGDKYYALTMFPYPSGVLHVGHWWAYTIPDAHARYRRMRGDNVLMPMGYDAFGLPAENAAIRNNIHPAAWTVDNIEDMSEQYRSMGPMIDWTRKVVTCTPEFYRWNQWLFLRMLERGLAYRAPGTVWWCPKDQTVLANEQVIDGDVCERCGSKVYKRELEQWYFRITEYADALLDGLETVDWPDRVKTMQRNWIGKSRGARLGFRLDSGESLEVFTTRPDTVFGATFMVMAPEHPLVSAITTDQQRVEVDAYVDQARRQSEVDRMKQDADKPKSGVFTGAYATNPVNDERIPIWIADYVLMSYGTGAIMAVPAHDERDFAFARAHGLKIIPVIQPEDAEQLDGATMEAAYVGPGLMINSGQFDGTSVPESIDTIVDWLAGQGRGQAEINYRLRDWLISRQRYWGTPIPVVYCDSCGMVPLSDDQLPVELPLDASYTPTGQSPLVSNEAFLHTTCPSCGGPARRETDTMDTFVDSSWYWFRYTSPHYEEGMFDPAKVREWTPVDLYTGGIEHAILHLLYARFITHVLNEMSLVDHTEPFRRLRNQGIILAEDGTKMSKSRGKQVSPDPIVEQWGADTLRLHLMYLGPWELGGPWNDNSIVGMNRFIRRAFQVVSETAGRQIDADATSPAARDLRRLTHQTIRKVTSDIEGFATNTMVAALIEFTNALMAQRETEVVRTGAWREAVEALVLMMAPATPFVAEEMWERLGQTYSVHHQPWPVFDSALLVVDEAELVVQVNGKVRDRITVPVGLEQDAAVEQVLALPKVREFVGEKTLAKVIYVPGRLINLVVKG
ncbi:MAG TPA: leucine--tRNA ligase [Thermomicrobiales bacterium]|jgi:leucyl-tRNA synthetase|nr:leucine--tRNA ligase [Thermomicrobiales bacterium]